jgi:hypothetical protein
MAYWECKTCCYGVTSSNFLPAPVVRHEEETGHVMDEVEVE